MKANPLLLAAVLCACSAGEQSTAREGDRASRPAASAPGAIVARAAASPTVKRFASIGRIATDAEIRAWDIDVNGSGVGLPAGRGSHERGAVVFARQCAICHGPKGEGIGTNPTLIGAPAPEFAFGRDPSLVKTVGNYWPYATTLYDYINRAMPFPAPGSLSTNDVYSVVAYLLAENGVIPRTQVIDAKTLPGVRMPARERFVVDDRRGGPAFR